MAEARRNMITSEAGLAQPTQAHANAEPADCVDCEFKARCMRYGWLSPARAWFPDVVVLCPVPGCRRFMKSIDQVESVFGVAVMPSTEVDASQPDPGDGGGPRGRRARRAG